MKKNTLLSIFVLILAFLTHFWNYQHPADLYWDENYYLPSATKYQKGVFFQQSHPPLAKLLMAGGDSLINPNFENPNDFEKTDYIKNVPKGYSFSGMRLASVLFSCLNCLLFFWLMLSLTPKSLWAFCLSFLFVFDNAIILQSRGAMLESIQIFGVLLALLGYFEVYKKNLYSKKWISLLSLGITWAIWTKINGLILILLLPLLLLHSAQKTFFKKVRELLPSLGLSLLVMSLFSVLIWQLHFSLGKKIEPSLPNNGWYKASQELKEIKMYPEQHKNPFHNFYIELRDYLHFMKVDVDGFTPLNLCKKDENASPFYWWPFGGRTISYRWSTTDSGKHVSHLYMISNPFGWATGLLSLFFTISFFLIKLIFKNLKIDIKENKKLLTFLILYIGYMFAMSRITRGMYIYNYFIPLVFTFGMASYWVPQIFNAFELKIKNKVFISQILFSFALIGTWYFYSPLTYFSPLSCQEFKNRSLFDGWDMRGVNCNFGHSLYRVEEALKESSNSSNSSK